MSISNASWFSGVPAVFEYGEEVLDAYEGIDDVVQEVVDAFNADLMKRARQDQRWRGIEVSAWVDRGDLVVGTTDGQHEAAFRAEYGQGQETPPSGLLRAAMHEGSNRMEQQIASFLDLSEGF